NGFGTAARRRRAVAAHQRRRDIDGDVDGRFRYARSDQRSQETTRGMTPKPPRSTRPILASLLLFTAVTAYAQPNQPTVDQQAVDRAKSAFVERMVSKHGFTAEDVEATLADVDINAGILET